MKPRRTPASLISSPPVALRTDWPFLRYAGAIFLTALAVRLLHVWLLSRSPFFDVLMGDAHGYDEWARRIAGGEWIGTDVFYQAPLYPYFLGVIYKVVRTQPLARSASSRQSSVRGRRAARRWPATVFSRRGWASSPASSLAVYAPAIFFDGLIQKSVLDLFFIASALWIVGRLVGRPSQLGAGWTVARPRDGRR